MTIAALPAPIAGQYVDSVVWPIFETPLVRRELVARRTMSFTFEKPTGWTFRAGQFVDITLIQPAVTDAKGDTRGFSISSAPSEGVLTITTRLRDSAFKRNLQVMPLGTRVKVEGPFGDLAIDDATRPAVVLTGGIGITPFRSILVEAAATGGLAQPVVVVYSNRRPEDAPFLAELSELAQADRKLSFVPTMTDVHPSDGWTGERGRIDVSLLRRHLRDVASAIDYLSGPSEPIYYLTGPAGLVRALRRMLLEVGIDEGDVRTEEFTGYE